MKTSKIAAIVAVAFLFGSLPSHAQQLKVATVDMNKIFSSYYKTKDAEARINEARAAAKKELDDRMDSYKRNTESINKLNEEISRTELSREKKEESSKKRDDMIAETKGLERDINEFRTTREKQLQDQAVRMRNDIVAEITKLVNDKVKSENYDLVLDRSGSSLNGVPILLYARDTLDFSDDIVNQLNKGKPKDTGAAPKK